MKIGHHYMSNANMQASKTPDMVDCPFNLKSEPSFFVVDRADSECERAVEQRIYHNDPSCKMAIYKIMTPSFVGWMALFLKHDRVLDSVGEVRENSFFIKEIVPIEDR